MMAQRYPNRMSFPSTNTQKTTMRDVAPLSIVFVSMMTTNNLCLAEVSFQKYNCYHDIIDMLS